MPLFSIFGKKKPDNDPSEASRETDAVRKAAAEAPVAPDPTPGSPPAEEAAVQPTTHRDLARLTAEKIDAIEKEIARDILKAPPPEAVAEPVATQAPRPVPSEPEPKSDPSVPYTHLFHITVVRLDNETMILPNDEMDS